MIPMWFGISVAVFLLTSLIPPPAALEVADVSRLVKTDPKTADAIESERRARALDLPRFINTRPDDVRSRTDLEVDRIAENGHEADLGRHHLARIGGAALPEILPELGSRPLEERRRIALALAPIGLRMGVADKAKLEDPDRALTFWSHFWEDRTLEFTAPAVRRAVSRLARRPTPLRERDIRAVDTFALEALIDAMPETRDPESLSKLTELARDISGYPGRIDPDAAPDERTRTIADWQRWWYVNRTHFVELVGAERVSASLTETRYGRWIGRAAQGELGVSTRDGEPVLDKLKRFAPPTLSLAGFALLVSVALALPLALLAAWRRGSAVDHATAAGVFALYSLPTFWVAELLARHGARGPSASIWLPVAALTLAAFARMTRYQRSAIIETLGFDYIRTARAKGASAARILIVHAMRNALMPLVTASSLLLPELLGGAFVVEIVFDIHGIGSDTLRAAEAYDTPMLVAVVLLVAAVTMLGMLAADVIQGLLDPRARERLLLREGRTT